MDYRELRTLLLPMYGEREAEAIARMVMEDVFGLSLTDVLLGRDQGLSLKERSVLENIALRLSAGEPVQQVIGHAHFCGHEFRVTPDVLIPRPETEELVAHVLAAAPSAPTIVDLGTGSGCIAISLALALPQAEVTGLDVSVAALAVAADNARRLGASVHWLQGDMLRTEAVAALLPPADVLVSNPPYICHSEASGMTDTVLLHEPHQALFVPDDDALCFYRAIAAIGTTVLRPDGRLFVEINAALGQETVALFRRSGYADVRLYPDQFGRDRFMAAVRSE